ncbi:MAG: AMP-binding protein [Acidobacteriaceae bacterium]|nr:AMP-binding protein [Acidobacteriaceae bacterium]
MNFPEEILVQLEQAGDTVLLQELHDGGPTTATGRELLKMIASARAFLSDKGLKKGDRCALLAPNSIRWIAMDLAIIAEGLIAVPLYARQSPHELVAMMKDCAPSLICFGDAALHDSILQVWPDAPPNCVFDEIFVTEFGEAAELQVNGSDPVAIIYTSGTSGEPKGVVLTAGNVAHILGCTSSRLDLLMRTRPGQDRVYQYAPLCFAAAWITLLTSLLRRSLVSLNTDLTKLSGEIRTVAPDYFVNVPALLERVRRAVDEQLWKTGGLPLTIYTHAKAGWMRKQERHASLTDSVWLVIANVLIFPAIRKKMIGENLKALICGSAPLSVETQLYFMMLGIPVLQVYGLTETTAICTMDDPRHVEPGRVGPAISGIEMKLGENDEILVRGPNIFREYWRRPQETAKVLPDDWFHTGDQGEVNAAGNWKIIGRIKNLIILSSGHNIAPEPIEDELLRELVEAQQVMLVGNGKGYLSAIVTGGVSPDQARLAIDGINSRLPHYKQIRNFYIHGEHFSVENGLMTLNGKLKRDVIAARLRDEIEAMYRVKQAV